MATGDGWTNPAVAEADEKNTLDWLSPGVATSSSSLSSPSVPDWLNTPVAVQKSMSFRGVQPQAETSSLAESTGRQQI